MRRSFVRVAFALLAVAAPANAEPLIVENGRIFVAAEVAGVPTEALLDSGAEATLIDVDLAKRAKLPAGTPQQIKGSGGSTMARVVPGVTIRVLGVRMTPEAIIVMDLTDLSNRLIKRPTRAIVGRELFDAARLQIDLTGGRIQVVPRSGTPPGKKLALRAHAGIEAVSVSLNGREVQAEFDLGNGSEVTISRALATELFLKPVGTKSGGGIGGGVQRNLVRLPLLVVAGRSFHDMVAAVDDQPSANEMNIGTAILKHFLITTDFHDRAVWLSSKER